MRECAKGKKIGEIRRDHVGKIFSDLVNEITLTTGLKAPFVLKTGVDGKQVEDMTPFALAFAKFILAHYKQLSSEEISLAFRLNAAGQLPGTSGGRESEKVEFYGSQLTLEHIGSVLFRYMQKRGALAQKLREELRIESKETPPTIEQQDMDDKHFANEYYRKYLSKEFSTISLEYAHMVYDILDRFKIIKISKDRKKEFMAEAVKIREHQLQITPMDRDERREWNRLLASYVNGDIPEAEQQLVKNYAKRIALMEAFSIWENEGRKKIFE